jgi:hypothetical protein
MTLPELRIEKRAVNSNTHFDLDDYPFWLWYSLVVTEAIDLILLSQPKPITKKHNSKHIDIEAIKAKSDIVAVVEGYGIRLRKAGNSFRGKCPMHNGKSFGSLAVYPEDKTWWCYGCNEGGDIFDFIEKMESVDFQEAVSRVK